MNSIKRVIIISKCEDCSKECPLRQLCGGIPHNCPLPPVEDLNEVSKVE